MTIQLCEESFYMNFCGFHPSPHILHFCAGVSCLLIMLELSYTAFLCKINSVIKQIYTYNQINGI